MHLYKEEEVPVDCYDNQFLHSMLEELKESASGGICPTVIVIGGTTARRFHTLFELIYILIYSGADVKAFSASFSPEEIAAIDNTLYKPGILFPLTGRYVYQHLKKKKGQGTPAFILIESHLSDLRLIPQLPCMAQTLVVTDVALPDRDMVSDIEAQLGSLVQKYEIKNILYNNDIYKPQSMKEEWAYIGVDRLPVRSRYAYGTHEGNDFFTRKEGNQEVLYMPNQKMILPQNKAASFAFTEGIIGAYATSLLHRVNLSSEALTKLQRVPLFEEYRTEHELFAWMKEYWYPEDMRSMLLSFPHVVMGANVYTRFQPVIENMIEEVERIIVVPETKEEDELLAEYFLSKEKDSYFTVLYHPKIIGTREITAKMWKTKPSAVLFDRPESFVQYVKKVQ